MGHRSLAVDRRMAEDNRRYPPAAAFYFLVDGAFLDLETREFFLGVDEPFGDEPLATAFEPAAFFWGLRRVLAGLVAWG